MKDDKGVSNVLGTIILFGILAMFLGTVTFNWGPVWAKNKEAAHSSELRAAMGTWGDKAEDRLSRGLVNEPFTHSIPMGTSGFIFLPQGASSGQLMVDPTPTLTISIGGGTVLEAEGALSARTGYSHHPQQTLRYVFGMIEVVQGDDAWADPRGFLTAERHLGGTLALTMHVASVTGHAEVVQTSETAHVITTVSETDSTLPGAGRVRFQAEEVAASAWRAAFQREFNLVGLTGETIADCTASTTHFCFDSDTNDADSFDMYVANVDANWTIIHGTVEVEL